MPDREGLLTPVPAVPLTQAQAVAVTLGLEDQPIRVLEGQPIPGRAGPDTKVREGRPTTGQAAPHIPVRAAPATRGPAGLATQVPAGAKDAPSCVVEDCIIPRRRPVSFRGSRSRECRDASNR